VETPEIRIDTRRKHTRVAIDGEVAGAATPLDYRIRPKALSVIVPPAANAGGPLMRTLVHLSDLHFGRVDHSLLQPLQNAVRFIRPDLVVVSGDLTQRAKTVQFVEAKRFLDALPSPQIVVPGNHDVPLWNVAARLFKPLTKFKRHITGDLTPFHVDGEIAVLGINTARSMVIKNGRINEEQIADVKSRLCDLPENVTKVIVTHHPFDLPSGHDDDDLVGRAGEAMQAFAQCGADLLLAGHMHTSHAHSTAERYRIVGHAALVVQAGTATSTRGRGEANAFNVLRIEHPRVTVERHEWQPAGGEFAIAGVDRFETAAGEWRRIGG
jgi:3',5'-cyclic AMP phosphodiesterase CpdA